MKNLIKVKNIKVETGKTTVVVVIEANEVPHAQLQLSTEQRKENKNAVSFLKDMMIDLGFKMEKPKVWVKSNNWIDKNDNIESCLDMDFSDTFPSEEKSRIEDSIKFRVEKR